MTLPADFQFSQSSLQDYVECARRFELRYLERLQWPAVEAEPVTEHEQRMKQGAAFHHMAHQHQVGVPADVLSARVLDNKLRQWWENYLRAGFVDMLPAKRHPEVTLSAPLGDYRLVAKYDLLAIERGGRAVIVDWKTAERRPSRASLERRLQTVVYRYLLAQAGAHLNGGNVIDPAQVEMVYWFAEHPDNPERFTYDTDQYQADREYLVSLVKEIKGRTVFDLTTETRRCRFCTYRSLCERGISAGGLDELETLEDDVAVEGEFDLNFDFDQIAEVEF